MDSPPLPRTRARSWRARLARAACAITALMAVTVGVAACRDSNGSPAAFASSSGTASSSSPPVQQGGFDVSPEQYAQLLKYAKCIRSHGVKNFPNPTRRGLSPDGIDTTSSQFVSADQSCHSLLPGGPHASQPAPSGGGS
jgi:hypothetical protein